MFQPVGSLFFPVSEGTTFNLLDMTVAGDGEDDYMDPGTEYVRHLDPATTDDDGAFTYVSKAWMFDNGICDEDTFDEFAWAIGWWEYDGSYDYEDFVKSHDDEHKVKNRSEVEYPMGTALLGNFDGNNLRFRSSGAVIQATTEFRDDGNMFPLFINYLPVEIDLNDIEVAGDAEDEYMDPGTEYVRHLDPATTDDDGAFTYVSKAWMFDNGICDEDTFDEFAWAIGWWEYDGSYDYEDFVKSHDDEHQIKDAFPLAPGFNFLGNFDGNNLRIRFPNPVALPAK